MNGEKSTIDYKEELESLEEAQELERKDWLKLPEGVHKVTFLSDGYPYTVDWEDKSGNVKTIEKVRYDVRFQGKDYSLGVTKGKTTASLHGQLVKVGAMKGSLIGETLDIVVKGQGKKVQYTVLQAIDQKDEAEKKSSVEERSKAVDASYEEYLKWKEEQEKKKKKKQ